MERIERVQRRRRRRRRRIGPYLALLAIIVIGALGAGWWLERGRAPALPGAVVENEPGATVPGALVPVDPVKTLPDLIADAWPCVVLVETASESGTRRWSSVVEGNGSGVLIDARGLVLTNAHVIDDAIRIQVTTPDGAVVIVTNTAADEQYDLAILDVGSAMADVTPLARGDSAALRVGEPAYVIGYPGTGDEALGETLTVGYISALDVTKMLEEDMPGSFGLIQTDAAINGGNSGGALLNAAGQLVGIPTLKLQSSRGMVFENLGFALPISACAPVIDGLIEQVVGQRGQDA